MAPKQELVRIALAASTDGRPRAVADADAKMPGRGAYLCRSGETRDPDASCLALAVRRGGLARTLRAQVSLDPKLVESLAR